MENNHFFDYLQSQLKSSNLSAIALELDIPKALLHDWVQARRSPSLKNMKHVRKIAEYLGVGLEYLLFGEEKAEEIVSAVTFEDEGKKYKVIITKSDIRG